MGNAKGPSYYTRNREVIDVVLDTTGKDPTAGEIAQQVSVSATKLADLALILRTHTVEGENQFLHCAESFLGFACYI